MRQTDARVHADEDRHRMLTTLLEEWSPSEGDLMALLVAMEGETRDPGREKIRITPTTAGGRRTP